MENNTMNMMQEAPQDDMAEAGRGTDTVLAHLSLGEVVIPRAFLDDPQVMQALQMIFRDGGADMAEYTVGDPANKINPETGYPEFRFRLGRILRTVAPLALMAIPGVGQALGAGILGANAAGAATLGNALLGAGTGALTGGGLRGALTGAALGGIGANIGNVGTAANPGSGILGAAGKNIPGLYDVASGLSGIGDSISSGIGSITGGNSVGAGQMADARTSLESTMGIKPVAAGASGLTGSVGGGNSLSGLSSAASAIGGLQQDAALKKQKQQLLAAQGQQLGNLENLNLADVQNDPGYQFNLAQGQQGLDRAAAAGGGLFSGAALKAASQYNQDFANNYYNQAYSRQAQKVGAQNDIYGNRGNILGNATLGRSNNINQSLANIVGGNVGSYNGSQQNYGSITNDQLLALLKQRGLA
jgi:hypothetical protein